MIIDNEEEPLRSFGKVLSWNMRDINDPSKIKEVCYLLKNKNVDMVSLMKTRVKDAKTKIGQLEILVAP